MRTFFRMLLAFFAGLMLVGSMFSFSGTGFSIGLGSLFWSFYLNYKEKKEEENRTETVR